jgi:hypothetical protein
VRRTRCSAAETGQTSDLLALSSLRLYDPAGLPAASALHLLPAEIRSAVTATLLPLPDDPRFPALIQAWNDGIYVATPSPRSYWLGVFERLLREFYPSANSDSLTLTARHAAPFPLALGPDVP